ncbi:MAG: hypothetical protein ACYC91_06275 [Solirubrobacteraceae bacterium]
MPAVKSSPPPGAGSREHARGKARGDRAVAPSPTSRPSPGEGLGAVAEELVNRFLRPLDVVLLTRERIQATLDEAADRGRVTRTDANELAAELLRRGRTQTEDLLGEIETLLGRGREQIESATKRARRSQPVDRLVRGADRARRSIVVGGAEFSVPVDGYDELTVAQVTERLDGLTPVQLRLVRDYERRHANRKSLLATIDKLLR